MPQQDFTSQRRVVVADDHSVVRQGTISLLEQLPHIDVVAEANNGLEAIAMVRSHRPDLLVLDAAMPHARGVEVFAETRRWSPDTAVVLLTGFTSSGLLADWLEAGVNGILLKSCAPEEMQACFEVVLAGSSFIAEAALERLKSSQRGEALTPREREVMAMVIAGNMNTDIAERLHISVKTVEKHRGSLMAKLGVRTVADLMVVALREGWLDEHKQL